MNQKTSCFSAENFDKVYNYISINLAGKEIFYKYEEYELHLHDNRIAVKKEGFTLSVISKEKGVYSLNKTSKSNEYIVDKTNQIFCSLVTLLTSKKN